MTEAALPSSEGHVRGLKKSLEGTKKVVVLTHDNPDPDAIAGALCLSHLLSDVCSLQSLIVYGGIISRPANRQMVEALSIPMHKIEEVTIDPDDAVILVDTQPGFKNNSLPKDQPVTAIIDHHEGKEDYTEVPFVDIRPGHGTCATIITEYFLSAGLRLTRRLATAICFGISTETQDLGREATPADVAAYLVAFPDSDQPLLGRLSHPVLSLAFFERLHRALEVTQLASNVAVCHLDGLDLPDTVSEIADLLVAIDRVDWILCTGKHQNRLVISVRTTDPNARAGELLRSVIGDRSRAGGHGMIAGGALPLDANIDLPTLQADLSRRFAAELFGEGDVVDWQPLIKQEDEADRSGEEKVPRRDEEPEEPT